MRVAVAGATSVLGPPVIGALRGRGHEVTGLTRSRRRVAEIEKTGATAVVADVNDAVALRCRLRELSPEAVVSLLITLPRRGPVRVRDFRATKRLWRHAVPNLVDAAAASGVRRLVAESVIFAYGYGRGRDRPWREEDVPGSGILRGHDDLLSTLREMERRVATAAALEGTVLRYGLLHGPAVPSSRFMVKALRWRLPLVPGSGGGLLSWIELGDAAEATADALERGRGGEIYNVVDDEPTRFADYARELAAAAGTPEPRSAPLWLSRLAAPHAAVMLDHTEVPVSNAKAKRELGWSPRFATPAAAMSGFSRPNPERAG